MKSWKRCFREWRQLVAEKLIGFAVERIMPEGDEKLVWCAYVKKACEELLTFEKLKGLKKP